MRWGSHIPVLEAAIDTFNITGALELGAGINSTPLLFARVPRVTSLECDEAWITELRKRWPVPEDEAHRLVYMPVRRGVNRGTLEEKLTAHDLERARAFYRLWLQSDMNLLFVDSFAGFRRRAIVDLFAEFDVVVYHDAEPKHDHQYGYSSMTFPAGWAHLVDRTFPAHTGVLLAPRVAFMQDQFAQALKTRGAAYAQRFEVPHEPRLEDITR